MAFRLIAIIEVADFVAFEEFEQQAAKIMAEHGGKIVAAWETAHTNEGDGEEIHLLEFPDSDSFGRYRRDARLEALATLRSRAIRATTVKELLGEKNYLSPGS